MINRKTFYFSLAVLGLLIGFAGVGYIIKEKDRRGIPFIKQGEQWTIGIYRGKDPFTFNHLLNIFNPVLRAEDVTGVNAKFVADPFLIKEQSTWYLFFEVYDNDTKQGDLAVATSKNTLTWKYQDVILDEPFHLSYPYVFKWQDEYYMIPETYETNSIRLYKAVDFPIKWTFVKTLVEGADYVDNSIAYFDNRLWIFSSDTSCKNSYLFFADDLLGPWTEHPLNPIITDSVHKARQGGRLFVYEGELYRYAQDSEPPTGTHQVFAYHITEISPTSYSEELVKQDPVVTGSGKGWNASAMHQVDSQQLGPNQWIASVDGFGKYLTFGLGY